MAGTRSNWMDLGFSKDVEERLYNGGKLYRVTHGHDDPLDSALEIAECLEILHEGNYGTGVQGGYADALVQYGYTNRRGDAMDKAIRSDFKALRENADDVKRWWRGVKEEQKRRWLSGTAIFKNWQAYKNPPPPKTEEEKADAKAKKIEAAKKLLGLKPGAPVPMAADWVPAGIGAKRPWLPSRPPMPRPRPPR